MHIKLSPKKNIARREGIGKSPAYPNRDKACNSPKEIDGLVHTAKLIESFGLPEFGLSDLTKNN
jgi:hypothetical protein